MASSKGASNANRHAGSDKLEQFGVTTEGIRLDLTDNNEGGERPIWPFSSYAPGKDAPKQLLEGALEQSPEEMRVQCYIARASGQEQQYAEHEKTLLAQVNQQIQAIKNDLEGAKRFVQDAQNQHPNRNDEVQMPNGNFPRPNGQAQQQPVRGFGKPSAFGASSSAAPSAFGQPSAPRSAFGAASSLGQSSSGFGQPSQLGGGGGFGKPPALGGGGSAFGQTSGLGQQSNPFGGAQKPAAFGQPSQPGAATGGFGASSQPSFGQSGFASASNPTFGASSQPTGAFGAPSQPSAFGQPSQPGQTSAFGQPSQPGQTSAFGQPSQPGQSSAFGQPSQPGQTSAFGQPSQPAQTSAFGQPSKPSGFGQPSQPSAFGQPSQPTPNPFGSKPSPFGQAEKPAQGNPFASASQNQGGLGSQTQNQQQPPFLKGSNSNATGGGLFGRPTSSGVANAGANASANQGKVMVYGPTRSTATSWKGKPLVRDSEGYPCITVPDPSKASGKQLQRVWFPDGPPPTNVQNEEAVHDPEGPPEVYEGQLGETLKGLYEFVLKEGTFKDGLVPEIPPMQAWVGYDC